jgi:hypothetical protein
VLWWCGGREEQSAFKKLSRWRQKVLLRFDSLSGNAAVNIKSSCCAGAFFIAVLFSKTYPLGVLKNLSQVSAFVVDNLIAG